MSHVRALQASLKADLPEVVEARRIVLAPHLLLPHHLAHEDYSAFHVGGWGLYLPRLAYLRARVGGRPFPLTGVTHSLHTADIFPKMREMLRAPFGPGDAVVCTSEAGRLVMEKHREEALSRERAEGQLAAGGSPLRLPVIPLGVDDACFRVPGKLDSRRALGLPEDAVMALYLGRLSAQTKADLAPLLATFCQVLRRAPTAGRLLLVIAGGQELGTLAALEASAQELGLGDRVRFICDVTDQQKYKLLGAADLFVSPVDNQQETFGLSIVEAMAAGLPVIASDFSGYRELVQEGVTGFRIPTYDGRLPPSTLDLVGLLDPNLTSFLMAQTVVVDTAILASRLQQLCTDPELRARLGSAGRERARREYGWPSVIARYESMWAEGKAQALERPPVAPRAGDPQVGDLHRLFEHYPSAALGDADRLQLSDLAREVLGGVRPPPALYDDLLPLVDQEAATFMLRLLAASSPRTLGACLEATRQSLPAPEPLLRTSLTWLLKQGLLERAG